MNRPINFTDQYCLTHAVGTDQMQQLVSIYASSWWNWSHFIRLVAVWELAANASVTLAGGVSGACPVKGEMKRDSFDEVSPLYSLHSLYVWLPQK